MLDVRSVARPPRRNARLVRPGHDRPGSRARSAGRRSGAPRWSTTTSTDSPSRTRVRGAEAPDERSRRSDAVPRPAGRARGRRRRPRRARGRRRWPPGGAAIVKCTSTSDPSASRISTRPRSRGRRRRSASAASSRSLGPDAEHDLAALVGRERRMRRESVSSSSASRVSPSTAARPPFARSIRASSMFIAGLPMKPPTKTFNGPVVELLRRRDLLQLALAHDGDPVRPSSSPRPGRG